jgi:ABC-type Fe3+/spermidine/putrescine transport system ATPase subunit
VSDRIAVMRTGEIAQCDRPEVLYDRPETPFVASFIGGFSLLGGRSDRNAFLIGPQTIHSSAPEGPSVLVVRPEDARPAESHPEIRLQGRVQSAAFQGRCWRLVVEVEGQMVRLDWPTSAEVGSAFGFSLPPDRCRLLPLKSNPKQSKPET